MNEQERKSKAKKVFWWTYCITVFLVIVFSSFLGEWLHIKLLSSAFVVPQMIAGGYAGAFTCRKAGVSAEEKQITQLTPHTLTYSPETKSNFEIRLAPMDKQTFWFVIGCVLVLFAFVVPLSIFETKNWFFHLFGFAMTIAGLFTLCATLKNRYEPTLLVQSHSPTFSQYSWQEGKKRTVHWNQVASCKIIESKGVWGQDTSCVSFLDASKKALATVPTLFDECGRQSRFSGLH